ncbi:MAG: hypothetical protein E6I80_06725 [Chloroflexi bacterium]|nr:MAG: hypothetical protein E6I80_06725 [Chloroflexota bacterium]
MDKGTIWVITSEPMATRGNGGLKQLKVEELSVNVNLFLEQMGGILEKTPEKLGKFHFDEFEVYAEVTGKGTLAILGTGGEVGATGGLRFVFRRSSASSNGK